MKSLRVLIIEDEALIALLFEDVLLELGHEVCASERTEGAAIAAAARCHPDLIISDARLQEGNGIAAVNTILKAGFVPHFFVSGDVIDQKLLNPAAGVLQKPFDERQLIEAISRAVDPANVRIGENHAASLREP
jgi:two-component system, response regulator PdtaR